MPNAPSFAGIGRFVTATVIGTIALYTGANFVVNRVSGTEDLQTWKYQSAQKAYIDINGNASFSGSVKSGGTVLTTAAASDARYVQKAGSTMTGTLVIANGKSLQVPATISGGTIKLLGTMSGNIVHAEKDLTSSGTMLALTSVKTRGVLSGSSLYIQGVGTTRFSNHTYTWPSTQGTNGQVLANNGSDTLSWATASQTPSLFVAYYGNTDRHDHTAAGATSNMKGSGSVLALTVGTGTTFSFEYDGTLNDNETAGTMKMNFGSTSWTLFPSQNAVADNTYSIRGRITVHKVGAGGCYGYWSESRFNGTTTVAQSTTCVALNFAADQILKLTFTGGGGGADPSIDGYRGVIFRYN